MVLYADGCQTQKSDVVVKMTGEDRDFDCEPLPTVTLRGVIAHFDTFCDKDVRVKFDYLATWACDSSVWRIAW